MGVATNASLDVLEIVNRHSFIKNESSIFCNKKVGHNRESCTLFTSVTCMLYFMDVSFLVHVYMCNIILIHAVSCMVFV